MADFIDRTGEVHLTNRCGYCKIIKYNNAKSVHVLFEDGTIVYHRKYDDIRKGQVQNPFHPTFYGIGYLGIGKYKTSVNNIGYKHAKAWIGLLERCYSIKFHEKYKTYIGCSVDENWHNFQNFAKWFEKNYNPETMQGWHLDKDILVKGNKIYSPETCCFVPNEINVLFSLKYSKRGEYPIGVSLIRRSNKYSAVIHKDGKSKRIGTFNTPKEAFQAYKTTKEAYIKEVADKWKDKISDKVYDAMINWEIEITD